MTTATYLRNLSIVFLLAGVGLLAARHWWWDQPITETEESDASSSEFPTHGSQFSAAAIRGAADRQPAPAFRFRDAQGAEKTLADFSGRVVLLNVWATWCGPCLAEMPELNALQQKNGDAAFSVVAVSTDQGIAAPKVRQALDRAGANQLAVFIETEDSVRVPVLPTNLLIDKQGRVAWLGAGPQQWSAQDAAEAVRALIAEPDGLAKAAAPR